MASSSTRVPIQEATTANRWLSRALIDKSPGNQKSGLPQGIASSSPASSYHPYSSEYNAGTCPVWAVDVVFFVFPVSPCYQVPTQMGVARCPSWCVDAVSCQKNIGAGYCARTNGVQVPFSETRQGECHLPLSPSGVTGDF